MKELCIKNHKFSEKSLGQLLATVPDNTLTSLEISDSDMGNVEIKILADFLIKNKGIKKLVLRNTNLHIKNLSVLKNVIQRDGIEEIDLSYNNLDKTDLVNMGILNSTVSIATFDLSHNNLTDSSIPSFVNLLTNDKKIRHLDLRNNNIRGRMYDLMSSAADTHYIEELSFEGAESHKKLKDALARNKRSNKDQMISEQIKSGAQLINMDFSNDQIDDARFISFFNQIKNRFSILNLNLTQSKLTTHSVALIATLIKLNYLESLNLQANKFNRTDWESLGNALAGSNILKEMDIGFNNLNDEGVISVARKISKHPSLLTLNIFNNNISDIGAQQIAQMLSLNTHLKTLGLCYNNIHALGAMYLEYALQRNNTLTTLNLSSNPLGVLGAQCLSEVLKSHSSLITLELYSTHMANEGVSFIVNALKTNNVLKKLNIAANAISNMAAVLIAQMLETNTTLEQLDLSENHIGDEGANRLATVLEKNKILKHLNMTSNRISENGLSLFKNNQARVSYAYNDPNPHSGLVFDTQKTKTLETNMSLQKGYMKGEGAYGPVYKAIWNNTIVAIKELRAQPEDAKMEQLTHLKHPHIIEYQRVSDIPYLLIMTYMANGTLYMLLHNEKIKISWPERLRFAYEIALALEYLHKQQMVHGRFTSHHVLLDNSGQIKLSGFDLSSTKMPTDALVYMAPELLMGNVNTKVGLTPAMDTYRFAIILWELLTRKIPSAAPGERPPIPNCNFYDKNLLVRCWDVEPKKRPSDSQIVSILQKQRHQL